MDNTRLAIIGSFVLSGILLCVWIGLNNANAATSAEYACLSQAGLDTGTSAVTIVDGCLVRVMDMDNNVACYVTPQGDVSCVQLRGN